MDFVQELEIELKEYEKVYLEMIRNYVFTEDEINFVKNEIKSLKTILSVLKYKLKNNHLIIPTEQKCSVFYFCHNSDTLIF